MTQEVNKDAVAQAFGRAARHYNQHAELQRLSGEGLAALARRKQGMRVLDAGCGTGWFSRRWRQAGNHVTALDLSAEMLQQAERAQAADLYRQGDIEALPFTGPAFDLCWSNLAVQWCGDLRRVLTGFQQIIRPGGQVLFSTVADGSLHELSTAWQNCGLAAPVNAFLTSEEIAAAGEGLALRLQPHSITMAFPDLLSLLRSLKGIGATHLHQGRSGGLLTRARLQQLEREWPQDRRGYLLSYHLIYGVIHRD
ncbi:malonyl-ACP O-methyltransferase BioC [Erwinia sp. P6884]|uniref:malonyl-ACP O-methyltransferase BioC n=1 Tax=Erwinia sp. P6884 TaxID=3141450 RepID=UPI003194C6B6